MDRCHHHGRDFASVPVTPNHHQRQLFTPFNQIPMPPSASNFLHQNHFPSHSGVFQQPQFVPVNTTTTPLEPTYTHTYQPRHHPLPTPPTDTQSCSPKPLPSVSQVPILTGCVDFGAWNDSVCTLILHLGLLGHIANPPSSGYPLLPNRVPSYMPTLSVTPSQGELTGYRDW